jgi:hypothetical protein
MAIIDKPDDYFNTKLYTGNGASSHAISGVGFQSDWTWIKNRSSALNHALTDSVRGAPLRLMSNTTDEDINQTTGLLSFNSDGFTVDTDSGYNGNGNSIVAWNWKAGGTASSNTDGSITSSVSVNTTSGFSVITFTGDGNADATVGHGLGVAPKMVIVKSRSAATAWFVYHASLTTGDNIYLNDTGAPFGGSYVFDVTSTVFKLRDHTAVNGDGVTFVAYCFAEKQGYSKFGSYTGNGDADGTFVYTGFKVAMIICKNTGAAEDWIIKDNTRDIDNPVDDVLYPNGNYVEDDGATVDFLSNGFKCRTTAANTNQSGNTFIYMAFAENPFVTSTGVPATAR